MSTACLTSCSPTPICGARRDHARGSEPGSDGGFRCEQTSIRAFEVRWRLQTRSVAASDANWHADERMSSAVAAADASSHAGGRVESGGARLTCSLTTVSTELAASLSAWALARQWASAR
eukprot:5593970-Prymnesium_polylepis.1